MQYKIRFIHYPRSYKRIKRKIDRAIHRVLSRGDLILRQDVEKFEKNLADFLGAKYAVGVNSGTDALIFSLKAAGIEPGDEVITVSHTFWATIEAILHCEAKPVLIEVREDFTMDTEKLEDAITERTRAVIPVHLNGRMVAMDKLMALARKYHWLVIEDAAQALGAKFRMQNGRWKMAGSFGDTGCFSFYPAKVLGCFGDGGAVVTNDEKIAQKIRLYRNHGQKSKTEIVCSGWTSRLDNLQAAVLNVRFKYLPQWLERRREIASMYDEGLAGIPQIKLPFSEKDNRYFDVYQNYVLRAERRDELFSFLKEKGVETLIKDPIPLHHHPQICLSHFQLPFTEQLAKEVISLPMYPELTNQEVRYVIKAVHQFFI